MSEARLDITGDTKVAQAEVDKLTRRVAGLTEQMRKLRETSQTSTKEAAGGTEEFADKLASVAQKFTTVTLLVSAATKGYTEWQKITENVAQAHDDLAKGIIGMLARSGQLAQAGQVQSWLHRLSNRGITGRGEPLSEARALPALGKALESGLPMDRAMDVAEEAAALSPTGEVAGSRAELMAAVSKMAPGMAVGDVGDTAASILQQLGPMQAAKLQSDSFQRMARRLRDSGMSEGDVLANAVIAAGSDEKGASLDMLMPDAEKGKRGHELLDFRRERDTLFSADARDRIRGQLESAQAADFGQAEMSGLRQTEFGRTVALQEQLNLLKEQNRQLYGRKFGDAFTARQAIREASQVSGTRFDAPVAAFADTTLSRMWDVFRTPNARSEIESARGAFRITQEQADKLIQALDENTSATKSNTQTAPKVNVDAHTE